MGMKNSFGAMKKQKEILPEIAQEMFDRRVTLLCLEKKLKVLELVSHPEFKEAKERLTMKVGKDRADEIMSDYFVESKGLFKK